MADKKPPQAPEEVKKLKLRIEAEASRGVRHFNSRKS